MTAASASDCTKSILWGCTGIGRRKDQHGVFILESTNIYIYRWVWHLCTDRNILKNWQEKELLVVASAVASCWYRAAAEHSTWGSIKSVPDLLLSFLQALAFTIGPALGPAQSFKDGQERCGQKFGQCYGVYRQRIFKEINVFSSILAQYRLLIYHFNENFRASTTVLSDS